MTSAINLYSKTAWYKHVIYQNSIMSNKILYYYATKSDILCLPDKEYL